MASIDQQLAKLEKRLNSIPKELKTGLQPTLDKAAAEVAASAKTLAPGDDGTLASTIRVEPGRHELSRAIVAGGAATTKPVEDGQDGSYDYAFAQELGTQHQQPNKFLLPAMRIRFQRNRRRITREAGKIIRALWGRP
ncbi:HK97-gp10 family putative phage morphogenesis protein [Methylopila sp. 73B]|uniref:HK97-gp10 family putative phage morphogenesis protein n=1 Tax=Methylopila sp. 73B TaxID=1120792 RepID=UPI000374865B|nr:HK97-gp10 family putative phage morphogenesis protein [Methylopila sp. 73B]